MQFFEACADVLHVDQCKPQYLRGRIDACASGRKLYIYIFQEYVETCLFT